MQTSIGSQVMIKNPSANLQQTELETSFRDQVAGAQTFELVAGEVRAAITSEIAASMVHHLDTVAAAPELETLEEVIQGGYILEIDQPDAGQSEDEIAANEVQEVAETVETAQNVTNDGTVPVDPAQSSADILGSILPGFDEQSQSSLTDLTELLTAAELTDKEGQSEFGFSFTLAQGAPLEIGVTESGQITGMFFAKPDGVGGGGGGKKGGGGGGDDTGDTETGLVTSYTSGPNGGYNIELNFVGDWAADPALVDVQQDFIYAADLISTIVIGDVPNIVAAGYGRIDDIVLEIRIESYDGIGNVLGGASFIPRSSDPGQPYYGEIFLDLDDVLNTIGTAEFDTWDDVAVHEMIHTIGFSYTTFSTLGLVTTNPDGTSSFTGPEATALNYLALGQAIPLEDDGGPGTELSHWEEDDYGHEVMTGFIDPSVPTFISSMTVAALGDIGYTTVDPGAWSDFTVGDPIAAV